MITTSVSEAVEAVGAGCEFVLFNGDCAELLAGMPDEIVHLMVTSPPYFMGKAYDRSYAIEDFYSDHRAIAPDVLRLLQPNGNVCWQVGYHVQQGELLPLDFAVHEVFRQLKELRLRNRIVWHFGHGTHAKKRFSGRHETILWYGKGEDSYFSLDAVRVPQKYPGKRHYKGPNKGGFSGNPLGKNPSDVWEIPNVNSNHVEKTAHPCQFPIALAQRLVRSLSPVDGLVVDPFAGSGTAAVAAIMEGRRFIGAELSLDFCTIAENRYQQFRAGKLPYRPLDKPILSPDVGSSVARRPDHFTI